MRQGEYRGGPITLELRKKFGMQTVTQFGPATNVRLDQGRMFVEAFVKDGQEVRLSDHNGSMLLLAKKKAYEYPKNIEAFWRAIEAEVAA